MKDVKRALRYAETAIFDQIWFTELNDIGCDEIEHSYFYDALSRVLFDATNVRAIKRRLLEAYLENNGCSEFYGRSIFLFEGPKWLFEHFSVFEQKHQFANGI